MENKTSISRRLRGHLSLSLNAAALYKLFSRSPRLYLYLNSTFKTHLSRELLPHIMNSPFCLSSRTSQSSVLLPKKTSFLSVLLVLVIVHYFGVRIEGPSPNFRNYWEQLIQQGHRHKSRALIKLNVKTFKLSKPLLNSQILS